VTDLERFFRRLVANLAGTDPARLHRPIPLADLQQTIVPYRANRRALELDTSEDYELVLLRLCAGEGGYLRTEPEDVRVRFAAEVGGTNPDLDILRRHEDVVVTLRSEPLARALDSRPDRVETMESPPESEPLLDLPGISELTDLSPPGPPAMPVVEPHHCPFCGGALPSNRAVNFCPHCGQGQALTQCPACRGELEPGWRHCVTCGAAIPAPDA